MNPIAWYLRARLRRRLFAWFGASILATALIATGIAWLSAPADWGWSRQAENLQRFVGNRFAQVWDDPQARDQLARDTARDLEIDVELAGADGEVLLAIGDGCRRPYAAPVRRGGTVVGHVRGCLPPGSGPGVGIVWFVVAGFGLWMASGWIAWRLTRPLAQLVKVTRALGRGELGTRVELGRHGVGEMGVLADAVNDMATRIEKQMGDQRELLAAVSHEIRTPLGHLKVLVDLAREQGADAQRLSEIEAEVGAIDAMVDSLLASSRVEFGTIDRRPLDAVEVAIRSLERADLDPTLLEAQAETQALVGDAALLMQALGNLLRNAAEHGGGVEQVCVRGDSDTVTIEVRDAGPGIPSSEIERVFEAFVRAERPGKAAAGSLGLGLSLVQRIAAAHGGEAFARNRDGGGAVVGVRLPRSGTAPEPSEP